MENKILIKNAQCIITCDDGGNLFKNGDLLVEGAVIKQIGNNIEDNEALVIDGKGKFVYPGLVNSHHHLLQAFTRNIPEIQSLQFFDWLMYLYNVWLKSYTGLSLP